LLFTETDKEFKSEVQILPVGKWDHPEYGEIVITKDDIVKFKENFDSKVRNEIAIDVEHEPEKGAVGWFKELINKGEDGLWAVIEWTNNGKKLIQEKTFKYFSPEFYSEYSDPETGEEIENVLMGGALTNRPYFKELQSIELSENIFSNLTKNNMKKKLSEEELEKQEQEKIEAEKKAKEEADKKLKEEEEAKKIADEKAKEEADVKAKEDEEKKKLEVQGSEKMISIKASELKSFRETQLKLTKMEIEKKVDGYTFSESNENGRILPKSKDAIVNFVMTLSEKQKKSFYEIVEKMPKVKLFKELGSAEAKEAGVTPKGVDEKSFKMTERAEQILGEATKAGKAITEKMRTEAFLQAEKEMKE
jgi:phage I-like protein